MSHVIHTKIRLTSAYPLSLSLSIAIPEAYPQRGILFMCGMLKHVQPISLYRLETPNQKESGTCPGQVPQVRCSNTFKHVETCVHPSDPSDWTYINYQLTGPPHQLGMLPRGSPTSSLFKHVQPLFSHVETCVHPSEPWDWTYINDITNKLTGQLHQL